MAIGVSAGFDLDALATAINKADKSIDGLLEKNSKLEKEMIQTFIDIGSKGVDLFLKKQKELQQGLEFLSTIKTDGASEGLKQMAKDASIALDEVNKLINSFGSLAYAQENASAKKRSQQYAQDREEMTRFYEKWINDTYQMDQEKAKREAILSSETAKNNTEQYKKDLKERERFYTEWINKTYEEEEKKRRKNEKAEKEKNKRIAEERAKWQAKFDSQNRRSNYQSYITSYEGALRTSDKAKSIEQERKAISNLQAAREKLRKTDDDYDKKLSVLNNKIRTHEENIRRATDGARLLSESHKELSRSSDKLGEKLAAAFSLRSIFGYAKQVVNVRGEFEMQHKAMQVLIGDTYEANRLWDKTVKLAVNSPFRVKELVTYTKQLAAYRIETDKLYDKTKMLADISAGLGVDMNRLILAYGQVKAANYLRGTELRQFSEAGINILKELSDYFTALEGNAVSVGDVFERVSKRMVSFADVDAVLQKVTSEGGAFYKMQEQQAETLQGMLRNLTDSADLMMNEIGKKNEGAIKGAVQALKSLVDNWRIVAELLKQGAIVLSISLITKAIRGLSTGIYGAAMSAKAMTIANNTLSMTMKRLAVSVRSLGRAFASNPLFLGATAITAILSATSALIAHNKAVAEANKLYEEAASNEIKRAKNFENLSSQIAANNKLIESSTKGTKENSEAIESNKKILSQLEKEYPTVKDKIKGNEEGTIDLTEAIAAQNEQLRTNIALQYQAKGSFWQDDLATNYADVIKEQEEVRKAIDDTKGAAESFAAQLELSYDKGLIDEKKYKEYKDLVDSIYNAKTFEDISKLDLTPFSQVTRSMGVGLKNSAKDVAEELRTLVKQAHKEATAYANLEGNIKNQSSSIKTSIQSISDEVSRGVWVEEYLKKFNIVDKSVKSWAKEVIQKIVNVKIQYPEPSQTPTDLEPWAKRVKDSVEKINKQIKDENKDIKDSELFPVPDAGQTKEQYLELAKSYIDIAKKVYAAGQQIEDESLIEQTNALKPFVDEYERILNIEKKSTGNEPKKVLTDRINLLKNLREEYLKLIKTFDEVDSKQKTIDSYRPAFEEAGMDIDDVDFTTEQGLIAALRGLEDLAEKEGLKAKVALQKAIGDVQVGIDVKSTQEQQKDVIDNIEEMFGNYEISLELDKLNIPPDLAKQLFGVDAISLDDIRSKIEAELTEARANGGKLDHVKDLEERLEKVKELEDKQLKERLKTYTEYLTKEQNTRVRMKLEELRKLEEVEELYNQGKYTQEQYATITGNIRREAAAEQAKQTWEDFAKTPYIVQMFDDLDKTSNKSLELLNNQLQTLKASLYNAGLPASELKEILDKINQVEKELEARNPFAQLGHGIKDLFTGNIDLTRFRKEYDDQIAKQAQADKEHESAVKDLNEYNEKHGEFGGNQAERQKLLDTVERTKQKAEKLRDATQQSTENFENARKKVLGMAEGLSTVLGYAQQLGSAFGDMAYKLGIMSEEEQAILNNAMNVVGDVANIGMAAAQIAANPANPAAWVQGISSVMSLIGNIAATGDAVREKEIQAEMKKLGRLEKAYEKLEKAMDDAYTIDQMRANKASIEQNIDAQIKALESANAKEEAMKKKDQDQIDANYEKIAELEEKKAELQRETVERLGGTYDYASVAEQFLDAWLEAFKETGDGLSGLEDNFDEFFSELAKKQLIDGGITKLIEPLQNAINAELGDNQQIDDWGALIKEYGNVITNINDFLTGAVSNLESAGLDIFSGDGSELSGLSKGIQGLSETQADILAAYWNAVRFDVSAIRQRFDDFMSMRGYGDEVNPVENHLKTISMNTTAILTLLDEAKTDSEANAIRVKVLNM